MRGQLGGTVKVDLPDLGLGLDWRLESIPRGIALHATHPGIALTIEGRPDASDRQHWNWSITRGEFDFAELWPLIRAKVGPAATGWSASGRLQLSGAGRFDGAKGLSGLSGRIAWRIDDGWARSDEIEASGIEMNGSATANLATEILQITSTLRIPKAVLGSAGVELAGIEIAGSGGASLSAATFSGRSTLRVATATAAEAGVEARDAIFSAEMKDLQSVEILGGQLSALGGVVSLRPFSIQLAVPTLQTSVDVKDIQLGEVARLMPWILQSAQGKLRGRVDVAWDESRGLRLRDGGLDIVKTDDASFRLAPSPGLLTGSMQPVFGLAPASWTWARRIGLTNPAYAPLKAIELGEVGLKIETFRVSFWPDGIGAGRPMAIHILGKPTNEKLVEEVVMDINFHGPLAEAIAFGLNQDFTGFNFTLQ